MTSQTIVAEEFIYEQAPFPSCHASTIVEVKGTLAVAWFGGTHEKHQDVGIWFARKTGDTWTTPIEVANGVQHEDKRYPCWNPVLFNHPNLGLMLFYKVGPTPDSWWGELMISHDGGVTWTSPRRLPEGIDGPVKNKPILLGNTLICPSSTEYDGWRIHMEISNDAYSWKRVGPLPSEDSLHAIQPSILKHPDGRLQILCRTKNNRLAESWSADHGFTWSKLKLTNLPNPNSGTDAVTASDGRHYLVYNPTSKVPGEWGGPRTPLVLATSRDGQNWQDLTTLEDEAGEYSYPAIIEGENGNLHITYTWQRERIKYIQVNVE